MTRAAVFLKEAAVLVFNLKLALTEKAIAGGRFNPNALRLISGITKPP